MEGRARRRVAGVAVVSWATIAFAGAGFRVLADCASFGLPFADLGSNNAFCAAIAEAYYTGITKGTSPTTFSPGDPVTRAQGAAFATRTLDAALARGSRRGALGQWWTTTPHYDLGLGLTTVGTGPTLLASDGADVWVANSDSDSVSRVRASDGKLLETWTGATGAFGVLVAMNRVFVTGATSPGKLYMIDPSQPAGAVTTVSGSLGDGPRGVAFDGARIWVANANDGPSGGSVSIITPGPSLPWSVTTVTTGFGSPTGIIFDGFNVWVTDTGLSRLMKLDQAGNIVQSIIMSVPQYPTFDGKNIWVPRTGSGVIAVVRASDGAVIRTLEDQVGSAPFAGAFDGTRVLVTHFNGGVSVWRASDLSLIGAFPITGVASPFGACSDGTNFWLAFNESSAIGRF